MRNRLTYSILLFITFFVMSACDPQESSDYSLGTPDTITADQVSFSFSRSTENDNIIIFTNTTKATVPTAVEWDLGNNIISKDKNPTVEYPYAGEYNVKMTVYAADGSSVTVSQVIKIENDDPTLLD